MGNLLQELFRGEFVIDETRERTISSSETTPNVPRTDSSSDGEMDQSAKPDLLTQISAMMLEQERLELLANELRQRGDQTSEEKLIHLFKMMLTVLDGFDRLTQFAMKQPPSEEVQNWLKSIASMQSRMTKSLESFGLRSMDPIGKPVNLNKHEVVEIVRTDSMPDETVVEVRQKGYVFNGRVLRDARVVVAKNERR